MKKSQWFILQKGSLWYGWYCTKYISLQTVLPNGSIIASFIGKYELFFRWSNHVEYHLAELSFENE